MKKLIRSNSDTVFFLETKKIIDEVNNNLVYYKNLATQSRKTSISKKINNSKRQTRI